MTSDMKRHLQPEGGLHTQWSTWPGTPQETPRAETAMDVDDAPLLAECDAVHAWTPSDRVIIEQMVKFMAREKAEHLR